MFAWGVCGAGAPNGACSVMAASIHSPTTVPWWVLNTTPCVKGQTDPPGPGGRKHEEMNTQLLSCLQPCTCLFLQYLFALLDFLMAFAFLFHKTLWLIYKQGQNMQSFNRYFTSSCYLSGTEISSWIPNRDVVVRATRSLSSPGN